MRSFKVALFANTDWFIFNFRRSLISALKRLGHDVVVITPAGPYASKFEMLGARWIEAPMNRRSLNPFREMKLLFWLYRTFKRERIDLIHSFTVKGSIYGGLAGRLAGVPARIQSIEGLGFVFIDQSWSTRALRSIVCWLMRLSFTGNGSRLILLNEDDSKILLEHSSVDARIIRLIKSCGVDCSLFSKKAIRSPDAPFRTLLACRLLWDKGLREFVEAARILKARGRNVEFLLAGQPDPGNPASAAELDVQAWVNEGLITWLGQVDDMAELLSSVHVVALPSYREGVPRILIEAAACGLPIVTTDAPGCREVVTHEVDGLLIPLKDAGALARAIARLEDEPELAERLGAAAQRKARAEFSEEKVISETLAVYQELSETWRDPA
jgi:glycosyltransferase involved in cell wall biosynthesis